MYNDENMEIEKTGSFLIQDPLAEVPALTSNSVAIITQVFEKGGVMKARTLENDQRATFCKDHAIVGNTLVASWKTHVLLWISGKDDAIMLATNSLEEIKPLLDLTIKSDEIPEGLIATDILPEPDDTTLIYISRTNGDESILQAIGNKTRVQN